MALDRRVFLGGAAAALAAGPVAAAVVTGDPAGPGQRAALDAIAAYVEAHRAHFGLPALAIVVVDGAQTFHIASGPRDYAGRVPIGPDDLWQIGSISKSFVALACLQLQQEGKLRLDADLRSVLPEAPLPDGLVSIGGLLDHTTGLPDNAPAFPPDGSMLWRGYAEGAHWTYSNTAYELLGRAVERIDRRPLATVLAARVLAPLGMTRSAGGIVWRDRARYPASWTAMRPDLAVLPGAPLAAAPWGESTFGAGSVAATMADMAHYLRFVIAAANGHGAPLLNDASAAAWLAKPVVEDPKDPQSTYGRGLMHRLNESRALLHHTGGMVNFCSSFHVDPMAGTGAFASTPLGYPLNYRPRLLTAFACHAMRRARAGEPVGTPPSLAPPPVTPGDYAGDYAGPAGRFTVTGDAAPLVVSGGTRVPLQMFAPDMAVAQLPLFSDLPLLFVRDHGGVIAADSGSARFGRNGASAALPPTPPRIAARAGHYQSDDPWTGGMRLVARGDRLYADGVQVLTETGDDVWRVSDDDWAPDRLRFGAFVNGRPMWASLSGRVMERRDG